MGFWSPYAPVRIRLPLPGAGTRRGSIFKMSHDGCAGTTALRIRAGEDPAIRFRSANGRAWARRLTGPGSSPGGTTSPHGLHYLKERRKQMHFVVTGRSQGRLGVPKAASKRESPTAEELRRAMEDILAAAEANGEADEGMAPEKEITYAGGGFVPCKGHCPGHRIPWYTSGFQ